MNWEITADTFSSAVRRMCKLWDFCRSSTAFLSKKRRFLCLETDKQCLLYLNKVNGNGISVMAMNMLWSDYSQFIARNITVVYHYEQIYFLRERNTAIFSENTENLKVIREIWIRKYKLGRKLSFPGSAISPNEGMVEVGVLCSTEAMLPV